MGTQAWTKLILAVTALGLIAYDIWVAVEPTRGDTISEVVNIVANDWPILPFAWGALTVHLFSRRTWTTKHTGFMRFVYLGIASLVVLAGSFIGIFPDLGVVPWLFAGGLAGWMWWPQFSQSFPE